MNGQFPGPIMNLTTNWNVAVNVRNDLDEPLLITWYCMYSEFEYSSRVCCVPHMEISSVGMVFSNARIPGRMGC